jgi:hypothetical protein
MRKILLSCASALMLCGPISWAKEVPAYESTGTIELTVNDKQATYHATSNTIPGNPEKMVHTANWRILKPMLLGGVNISPPGILISITARPTVEPDSSAPWLKITFFVDENDYSLLDRPPFEVKYTIKEGALAGDYQHATGSLDVLSFTMEGDLVKVSGLASGTLAGSDKKKSAKPTLDYDAEFVVHAHPH